MQVLGGDSNETAVTVMIIGVAVIPTICLLDCSPLSDSVQGP